KMHGIGNDYVYVNGFEEKVANPPALAKVVADRHFGIGSDGLILILPSDKADVRMRIFNADGSEGEMCGNGIRCVAKYTYDHGLAKANPMRIETGRGVLTLDLKTNGDGKVKLVTVDMGEPILEPAKIQFDPSTALATACGTGACAVTVAGVLTGRTNRKLLVHLPGGDLEIEWREADNNLYMTGPATEVFSGEWTG